MLAVGRLVRIVKTIGDKVISKSRFYNTFNYVGYERQARARFNHVQGNLHKFGRNEPSYVIT